MTASSTWGPFDLRARLGHGAFGEVYRVWDPQLERHVALKLLFPRSGDSDYEATLREARAMARVHHPNVAPVYGVDSHDGRIGFWSEYIHGSTLEALVRAHGPFNAREAALIGADLCRAVAAVHAAGMLHRDIKASNVMREAGGRILLLDFGLSHDRGSARFGGTPVYMAPELLRGEPATESSDLYAVGVLLYYLVSGALPVEQSSPAAIRAVHAAKTKVSLYDRRPDLPHDFVAVVEKATAPAAAERYSSGGQMLRALEAVLGKSGNSRALLAVGAVALTVAAGAWYWTHSARDSSPDFLRGQQLMMRTDKPANLTGAMSAFEKAIRDDSRNALAYVGLARAQLAQYRIKRDPEQLKRARENCNRAADINPRLSIVHAIGGQILNASGQNEAALQEVQRAIELDPRSADAWSSLGTVYSGMGRKDAEEAIRKAVDLSPEDWRWHNQLATYYFREGNFTRAAEEYAAVTRLTPDNAFAWNNLGSAELRLNRLPEAREALKKAVAIGSVPAAYSGLGIVLLYEGRSAEAVPNFERAVRENPSDYAVWGNLGHARTDTGDREGGKAAFRKALELAAKDTSSDPVLAARIGQYQAELGMRDEARASLRRAVALAGENPAVLAHVATGLDTLGMRKEALDAIFKALDLGYSLEYVNRTPGLKALREDELFRQRISQGPVSKK